MHDINEEELIRLYIEKDLSLRELAKVMNINFTTAKRRLIKNGINIKDKSYKRESSMESNPRWRNDIDDKEIIRLYTEENMSLTAISKHLVVDRGVVTNRIKKQGIAIERKPRADKSKDNSPVIRKLFYKYKRAAEKRNYNFDIDYEFFIYLTEKNCYYCGSKPTGREYSKSGHEYIYNGLDRMDNDKGYTLENVVTCCKWCNQMKSTMNKDEFINHIKRILEHYHKNL